MNKFIFYFSNTKIIFALHVKSKYYKLFSAINAIIYEIHQEMYYMWSTCEADMCITQHTTTHLYYACKARHALSRTYVCITLYTTTHLYYPCKAIDMYYPGLMYVLHYTQPHICITHVRL